MKTTHRMSPDEVKQILIKYFMEQGFKVENVSYHIDLTDERNPASKSVVGVSVIGEQIPRAIE